MNRHLAYGLLIALAGCGSHPPAHETRQPAAPAASVRVEESRELARAIGEEVVGTVHAKNTAMISSSIMGTVRDLRVTLGSPVRQGDVLVRLQAGEIEAKANQARAVFAQAEVNLRRATQLHASHSIPQAELDAADAQFRVAQAALAEAQVMAGYTTIRSPISGVVTAKESDVGDLAVPGHPLLVLESPGAMRLEAFVPETLAHRLARGTRMPVHVDALGRDFEATVAEQSPSADPASRTVLIKLDLPETPELRSGMFGRLVVPTGEDRAVTVPREALVRRGQMETVFVADHGHARLRIVRAGRSYDGRIELLSGLAGGEPVIVTHAERLLDGQAVTVQP